jgi:hypothetical protein
MHTAFVDFMGAAGATEERIRLYTEPQPRLTMSKSAQLYAIRDGEGLWLAFPTEAEAAGCLVPSLPAQKVEALKFGDLVERQPRALVHIHEQYYRAEELA